MGQYRYNWAVIRRAYVSGEMPLTELAREHTGIASDPSYKSLRNHSSEEGWEEQRRTFRDKIRTEVANVPSVQQKLDETERVLNYAEAIARHTRIAKSLQADCEAVERQLKDAIASIELSNLDPLKITLMLQRIVQVAATAADIERKAMGISDPEQRVKVDTTLNASIDFSKLSDEELISIASEK